LHEGQPGAKKMAEQLWDTGIHDARLPGDLVADPMAISEGTMDRWAQEAELLGYRDGCCCNLFDRTLIVWRKIGSGRGTIGNSCGARRLRRWLRLPVHDKKAPEQGVPGSAAADREVRV